MELMLKDYPSEVEIGASMASLQNAMESQKQLFHKQIDHLRNVVVTQCKLTGVNPLSQEMAAGALSIKIGKRPRDLLNPKAVKYMQAVFSIKDSISKKESREIGALFGLTVTQVREYFASQRTRVRKIIRVSREKAVRASTNKELQDSVSADANPLLDSVSADAGPMLLTEPVPLMSIGPPTNEEVPSCSNQDEALPGLDEFDKHFVENIFSLMIKEESFSGQVKLMEWILRVENPSVLSWFLSKDGVMILDDWLSQAANEEQTSVLSVILKVLCHLPLNKALPVHMSVILQGVNRLRFYRVPDISNRARVLLSKWSKMFAKSQALKKPNGTTTTGSHQEINLSQRLDELMGDGSWQSSLDNPDAALVPYACPDDIRKLESQEGIKLLTASSDDSNRKHILGTSSAYNKERRKVLLVEQPGQKTASKSPQVKAVPVSQTRPITADEIQKAKMRAHLMQSNKTKTEGPKRHLLTNDFLSASEAYLRPKLEAQKKAWLLPPKSIKQEEPPSNQKPYVEQQEPPSNQKPYVEQKEPPSNKKPYVEPKESFLDKCRRIQIPWWTPPDVQLHSDWGVGTGENSKEIEIQNNRTRREKETFYCATQEVPLNPKEPWDTEMDYDDTLTPEIPIEQLPETDGTDATSDPQIPDTHNSLVPSETQASTSSNAGAEPDLELLAVLLKNPELVFALTSGQASGLSSEDTVKLLDMLKSSGGLPSTEEEVNVSLPSPTPKRDVQVSLPSPTPSSRIEVSLPSPTPSSNPGPNGWTLETTNNPFSRHTTPVVATAVTVSGRPQSNTNLQSPFAAATVTPPLSQFSSHNLITENQLAMHTQTPANYHQVHSQLSHLSGFQEFPEDNNMRMTKARHHGLPHNSLSSQNTYNPITRGPDPPMRQGFTRERNEFYPGGQTGGYESWSPERSPGPGMYHPEHQYGHGRSYPDQRSFGGYGHGPPPDRPSRNQNLPGFRDHNWQGAGGNRRWHDGDRRR
ncbi:homeobox protein LUMINIDEPENDENS [Silene latifolia]|uniref:homeobox protein LUMINIDEPENDENS n=1 Tax=Silene latifolia TaxID=37657 RepID=UPI003D76A80E